MITLRILSCSSSFALDDRQRQGASPPIIIIDCVGIIIVVANQNKQISTTSCVCVLARLQYGRRTVYWFLWGGHGWLVGCNCFIRWVLILARVSSWIDPESGALSTGRQHSKKHSLTQLLPNKIRDLHANVPCCSAQSSPVCPSPRRRSLTKVL